MELEGKIKLIKETETFRTNGFQKRDIVITTDDQYPQDVVFQFIQDSVDLLDNYKIEQEVKIKFNIRGKEWTSPQGEVKYFNTLQGWRIESIGVNENAPTPISHNEAFEEVEELTPESEEDDLPF